ncbi:hypothetical protein FRC19_000276 [Serendipita sp. 401]|nr:hypothetical protein FRC15_010405 [Serendipita sp. 397]KAG8828888.1 hypothetical protein FRC19_000276 [Serendipita sp. 401]KAG9056820.1 hypothetical protein FS842_009561 [Serendipita sp. 407]
MITSKVGLSKKSNDPELDEYTRNFEVMEKAVEALLKDSKIFAEAVITILESGSKFAEGFSNLFHPMVGEYDIIGKYPEAAKTAKNVDKYANSMQELRETLRPELDLIETRIVAPTRDFQGLVKTIRKNITKREHKLVDYDRHNNSLTKLRDKKEKSLNDEKNLFKLEQEFDLATQEYDALNSALKTELPQFMVLATRFIDPLFHSFYYMQLNIYYLMMEKLQGFAMESKYPVNGTGLDIQNTYEGRRGDAYEKLDSFTVNKRMASSAVRMAKRQETGGSSSALSRSTTSASSSTVGLKKPPPPPPGAASSSAGLKKMPPPPPTGSSYAAKRANSALPPPSAAASSSAPPPPYTPGNGPAVAIAAATKRPPPPPPSKAKKPAAPQPTYVIAMYDFSAQADGDLDFKTGDQIEVLQRTGSTEDWWKGRLNGREGVFPGNYVRDA